MFALENSQASQHMQDSVFSVNSLNHVKQMGRAGDTEALREVARQFESLFIQQMLKQMRASNDVFSEGGMFDSSEMRHHEEMYHQQLGLEMAKGRGIGLADALYDQMKAAYGKHLPQGQTNAAPEAPASSVSPVGRISPQGVIRQSAPNPDAGTTQSTRGIPNPTVSVQPGGKTAALNSPAEFVEHLTPYAEQAAEQLGVDPSVLLAQAALETGWGRHVIHTREGDNSHNLFNIKADRRWDGDSVNVSTLEYRNGVAQQERADFRRYDSYAESFADYVEFLQNNPRYQQALSVADDADAYARELQNAGYATDPAYADKISRIMNSELMRPESQTLASARDALDEA
ncbi:flagellar assembly peptidoglycan hydrolase FlgJ [Marinimicrobium alkaliphilum]|uniref:flagellar assembly peptidoglycan hydrolase FlgJ n=1 Tax=Marinimicrobium alkaliphilum TaxID=2202654 RepID=UPI000DB9F8C6|nr:flagellar assembly peptidoglycan hydrolase FlgJ [Marinimicrobium alkaliphilum]